MAFQEPAEGVLIAVLGSADETGDGVFLTGDRGYWDNHGRAP
jgi:hypothetical protein